MPTTCAKVKVEAVREFGGQVELVDVATKSRVGRVAEIAKVGLLRCELGQCRSRGLRAIDFEVGKVPAEK